MKYPKRQYEIKIQIGADSWEHAVSELNFLANHIEEHGPTCCSIAGSPSSNHRVSVEHNPETTHDKYFEELDKVVEEIRKEN